jgi:hypothetical protein
MSEQHALRPINDVRHSNAGENIRPAPGFPFTVADHLPCPIPTSTH